MNGIQIEYLNLHNLLEEHQCSAIYYTCKLNNFHVAKNVHIMMSCTGSAYMVEYRQVVQKPYPMSAFVTSL